MIDTTSSSDQGHDRLSTDELGALVERLARLECGADDAELVAQVATLERVKSAAAAAQARATHVLHSARDTGSRGHEADLGAQVGLARHESPYQGRQHVRLSTALMEQLPHTLAALADGDISERDAMIVATETETLAADDRRRLDRELDPHLGGLGEVGLRQAVRRIALGLDEAAASARHRRARADRRVTGRLLQDGTAMISAFVLQEHYAMVMQALDAAAASGRAAGDERSSGQLKADTLVERVTGHDTRTPPPVTVDLVIGVETLLGTEAEPGYVPGIGYLPATICRDLVLRACRAARATLRRLFAMPGDRELVAMESGARAFPPELAELIDLRDGGLCRTPWCSSRIRHHDHVVPVREGGETSLANGQGLCESCNYVKEGRGWVTTASEADGRHEVITVTPAGDVHRSHPPPAAGRSPTPPRSRVELIFTDLVLTA